MFETIMSVVGIISFGIAAGMVIGGAVKEGRERRIDNLHSGK